MKAFLALIVLVAGFAIAGDAGASAVKAARCRTAPDRMGSCFWVHGVIFQHSLDGVVGLITDNEKFRVKDLDGKLRNGEFYVDRSYPTWLDKKMYIRGSSFPVAHFQVCQVPPQGSVADTIARFGDTDAKTVCIAAAKGLTWTGYLDSLCKVLKNEPCD